MKPRPGDVFCVYNRTLERYTACQVTKVKEKGVVELVLDWTGDRPLSPEELPALRPLAVDYLFWSGGYDLTNVPPTVPGNYIRVGNIPPLAEDVYSALCGLLEELPESALDRRALVDVFEAERDF